jgi:hypothetical protein
LEEKLKAAFESANYMTVLASQKKILKEEYYQNVIHYHNGGVFSVNQQLLTFVKMLVDLEQPESTVLIDDNDTPIEILNLKDFFTEILSVYFTAANDYYTKHSNLKKSRTITKLLDL